MLLNLRAKKLQIDDFHEILCSSEMLIGRLDAPLGLKMVRPGKYIPI